MNVKFLLLITLCILGGCAKTSRIINAETSESFFDSAVVYKGKVTYQSDLNFPHKKYRLFKQGSTGYVPLGALKVSVLRDAESYCRIKKIGNQRIIVLQERESTPPHVLGNWPRFELIFGCLPQSQEPLIIKEKSTDFNNNKYDDLLKLKKVYEAEAITEKEYRIEKKKILGRGK